VWYNAILWHVFEPVANYRYRSATLCQSCSRTYSQDCSIFIGIELNRGLLELIHADGRSSCQSPSIIISIIGGLYDCTYFIFESCLYVTWSLTNTFSIIQFVSLFSQIKNTIISDGSVLLFNVGYLIFIGLKDLRTSMIIKETFKIVRIIINVSSWDILNCLDSPFKVSCSICQFVACTN
jgi:hypothetical protein